jgi:hypothetical protein
MSRYSISHALSTLVPGALWEMHNESYETIQWNSPDIPKPTKEEIDAEVARLNLEWESTEYQRLRASEYPPVADYLDAVVKNDTEQMQAYIDACQAVKNKYPKSI